MLAEMQMTVASYLPPTVKRLGRRLGFGGGHPQHPKLAGVGVVYDVQPWIVNDQVTTLVPVHNYFSVLFPEVETATTAEVFLWDARGRLAKWIPLMLAPHALSMIRLASHVRGIGTVGVSVKIPPAVADLIRPMAPYYFWDRFVVGYQGTAGPPSFVHGVDKTWVHPVEGDPFLWYPARGKPRTWTLEMPITVTTTQRVSLLLVNRTSRETLLTVRTQGGASEHRQPLRIDPLSVQRYFLPEGNALRVTVEGLPTTWGRPILVTEYANGAVDALHT